MRLIAGKRYGQELERELEDCLLCQSRGEFYCHLLSISIAHTFLCSQCDFAIRLIEIDQDEYRVEHVILKEARFLFNDQSIDIFHGETYLGQQSDGSLGLEDLQRLHLLG